MSRFLKFIVNTFLIVAILVAAAILIPLLLGVRTTIVDTPTMDTNLPLGSITYATDVDASALRAGDQILKDNNISTYAYIIRSGDETTGRYNVVSSTDPEGREEEISLFGQVPKVAVIVPYIGYIMIAMHSIEGIIIIALVIILMIILFILSELWKRDDEDDDEDQEAVVNAGLDPAEVNGIDTAAIREAAEARTAAENAGEEGVYYEGGEQPEDGEGYEEEPERKLSWRERRALKKAQKRAEAYAEAEAPEIDRGSYDAAEGNEGAAEGLEAAAEAAAATVAAVGADDAVNVAGAAAEESAEEVSEAVEASGPSTDVEGGRVVQLPEEPVMAAEPDHSAEAELPVGGKTEIAPEIGAKEMSASAADAVKDAADEVLIFNKEKESAPVDPTLGETKVLPDLPVIDESVLSFADTSADEGSKADEPEVKALEEESEIGFAADKPARELFDVPEENEDASAVRFTPVKRPNLTEMIDAAKATGETPYIIEDDDTGVTVVDYSDLI